MCMWITKVDVDILFRNAIHETARTIGIQNVDFQGADELLSDRRRGQALNIKFAVSASGSGFKY